MRSKEENKLKEKIAPLAECHEGFVASLIVEIAASWLP